MVYMFYCYKILVVFIFLFFQITSEHYDYVTQQEFKQ